MILGNHPGMFLADDAAVALSEYERAHGVLNISRAGALVSEQQGAIDRWDKGGVFNRPPYLYPPYRPASGSSHVRDGGKAIDTPEFKKFAKHSLAFGFKQTNPKTDPVHFEFIGYNSTAGKETVTTVKKRKLTMHELILVLDSPGSKDHNTMVLVNLKDKTLVNLGNSDTSAVRAYYANNLPYQFISSGEWENKFGVDSGFNYILAI